MIKKETQIYLLAFNKIINQPEMYDDHNIYKKV